MIDAAAADDATAVVCPAAAAATGGGPCIKGQSDMCDVCAEAVPPVLTHEPCSQQGSARQGEQALLCVVFEVQEVGEWGKEGGVEWCWGRDYGEAACHWYVCAGKSVPLPFHAMSVHRVLTAVCSNVQHMPAAACVRVL